MKDKLLEMLMRTYELSTFEITVALAVSFLMAAYIFIVYRVAAKAAFYSKSLNITLAVICIITTAIIIAMQSSLVISLGMVGALSIIRFRTAVKDPMDLMFLFWSIGAGIICGAGLYVLAFIVCVVITLAILAFEMFRVKKAPYLLIINSSDINIEESVVSIVKGFAKAFKVKSRNITARGLDMIIELRTGKGSELVKALCENDKLTGVSLLSHDGETRF